MRLYSRTGAGAQDDPEFGHFEPGPEGGFDFPNELSDRLHYTAVGGKRLWEDELERQARLIAEEAERRSDPRTLLDAVEAIQRAAAAVTPPVADPSPPSPVQAPRSRAKTAKP